MKHVDFEPMEKMLNGLDIIHKAVSGTLGPCGLNVYIDDPAAPVITNDGAKIAQNIRLTDDIENMGANIIRNTSSQTNDDAGDGTTTTAVLVHSIIHESLKRPENKMFVRKSLKDASVKVLEELKKRSKTLPKKGIKEVALISSEDNELADIVTDIINKIGADAVVTVEDSWTNKHEYEIVEGYQAHVGFMDAAFISDAKRARCVKENVPVLVTEKKISSVTDLMAIFNLFQTEKLSEAVIVCNDIEDAILGALAKNKQAGIFNSLVIRATGDLLKDIEAVVGATRVSDVSGVTFQNISAKNLGWAKKVVSDSSKTLFIPKDPKKAITYANHLQKFVNDEPNMYVKQKLERRVSQLKGGVAVLKVGTNGDYEREYIKLKAEDTVKAVKAALEEGIVEGGGMALWRISDDMKPQTIGEEILKKALKAPLKKIIENAGKDYADIVRGLPKGMGYDAKNDCYTNMIKSGIIDPTKVERCAVENSVSSASTFITSFCTITNDPKKD